MNTETTYKAVLDELKRYFEARCTKRTDNKGSEWRAGLTIVSPEDKRLEEMARLCVAAIERADDGKPRQSIEARALKPGDVFTRYDITKDGIAIDEEVTVVTMRGTSSKPIITYRGRTGAYCDCAMEGHYLLSVYRPTAADLMKELDDADHA